MRFYDAEAGGIFVDGRDVRTYQLDDLRRKFGVVFQNDMVFFNTLRENIRFGRDLSDQALWAAVEDAAAKEYIRRPARRPGAPGAGSRAPTSPAARSSGCSSPAPWPATRRF